MSDGYKPFTPKPKHEKAEYIKRKEKWDESLEAVDEYLTQEEAGDGV